MRLSRKDLEIHELPKKRDFRVVFFRDRRVGRLKIQRDGGSSTVTAMVYHPDGGIGCMTHGHDRVTNALDWIAEVLCDRLEAEEREEAEEERKTKKRRVQEFSTTRDER